MLVWNYKPSCAYSIAVMLAFRQQRPLRRTLRYRCPFALLALDLRPQRPKYHALSVVTLICDQAFFRSTA